MKIVLIILLSLSMAFATPKEQVYEKTQHYLMLSMALYYESKGNLSDALSIYEALYGKFAKDEYERKILTIRQKIKSYKRHNNIQSVFARKNINIKAKSQKLKDVYYIDYLIAANKKLDALQNIKKFANTYTNPLDALSIANFYTKLGMYEQSISYYKKYIDKFGCEGEVCDRLSLLYQINNQPKQLAELLIEIYNKNKTTYTKEQKKQSEQVIALAIQKYSVKEAIKFLKEHKNYSKLLSYLYKIDKQYQKSIALAKKLYKQTQDIDMLAQATTTIYESAKDKNSVLKQVIKDFEIILKHSDDAIYKNYYGYLLIDHDIDIKKGLKLAKQAYKQEPKSAYEDSIAWGYYKLKKCNKAYVHMKNVIKKEKQAIKDKVEGSDVLLSHYKDIKKCYKQNRK